ncbi:MAG: fumarylacetoacetate hydrolase family protein [Ilumatobacteraceae bacterium]|nr:fumarylacetoacetate hydrolase family protein [Ilumatobacteraceae bacterium]
MKLANLAGRATVLLPDTLLGIDVAEASGHRFGPDIHGLYDDWESFREFAAGVKTDVAPQTAHVTVDHDQLRSPAPLPRQVFGIGLNYRAHAAESGMPTPSVPATFTKFPASLTGPFDDVTLSSGTVDWEVELVAVIGVRADRVTEADGWRHIAGLTVGQDISDRTMQFAAGGQFSLGKSYRGYGPMGPWLVTPDDPDVANADDLALGCSIAGEIVQQSRTSDLIFGVARLVAELSAILPLMPGDVIFTGTPDGVGVARKPPRFLQPGEIVESWVEGIGTIRNRFVSGVGS